MSDAQNTAATTAPAAEATAPVTYPAGAVPVEAPATTEPQVDAEAPKTEAEPVAAAATEATPAEEAKADTPAAAAAAEKAVEPITQGQLAYKGPGLVKSLIPSKKELWLSDEPVQPQNLDLFMRGEKPEVSHAIVAWASQTGKGLLFINKKNDAEKTHPADVLALYDATDLKKHTSHEFSFKINGHPHTFKAASEAERDGWYVSIEKAIELGKASKEDVRNSEGYKAELEKLNKPTAGIVGAGSAKRSQSQPKKSTDAADKSPVERTGSSDAETDDKKQKRSTSRGMLERLKGKKEEAEHKSAEKKEDKQAEKEEKKAEETGPVSAETEAAPVHAGVAAAEIPAAADVSAAEPTNVAEDKPKPTKRNSVFGKVTSAWGSMKSPVKEKEQKDAELKPEVPAKDGVVSENPPVLPETAATTEPALSAAVPAVEEPATGEKVEAPKEEAATPSKEKGNFLSSFMKRNRSVSPSTPMKEPTKKEETPATAPTTSEEASAELAAKTEEPAAVAGAEAATGEPAADKAEEQAKTETSTSNKRQSMLGSLGRRASKALNRMQAPKKEAPATRDAKKEEAGEAKAAEETPQVNGETKATEAEDQQKSIGDVVPEAVDAGKPQQQSTPTVTASA